MTASVDTLRAALAILIAVIALGGCAAPQVPPQTPQQATPTTPEPEVLDVLARLRLQLRTTVERTSAVIAGGTLAGIDLARSLCTRAEALADLGEVARGLDDAQAAWRAAPAAAEANLCRANLYFAHGDFGAAAADYTRALERADDPFEALYRRGQAWFFDHRFDLAAADFGRAAAAQHDETARLYALLWQAMALQREGRTLPPSLRAEAGRGAAQGDWPRPALALFGGSGSVAALMGAVDIDAPGEGHSLALAEAWFYVGEHRLIEGRAAAAREAFIAARAPNATMTLAHLGAGFELARLSN